MKIATTKNINNASTGLDDSLIFFNSQGTANDVSHGYPQLLYKDPSVGLISYSGSNTFQCGVYWTDYQSEAFTPAIDENDALGQCLPENIISKPGDTAILHRHTYSGTHLNPGTLTDRIVVYYKISQEGTGKWVNLFSGTSVIVKTNNNEFQPWDGGTPTPRE